LIRSSRSVRTLPRPASDSRMDRSRDHFPSFFAIAFSLMTLRISRCRPNAACHPPFLVRLLPPSFLFSLLLLLSDRGRRVSLVRTSIAPGDVLTPAGFPSFDCLHRFATRPWSFSTLQVFSFVEHFPGLKDPERLRRELCPYQVLAGCPLVALTCCIRGCSCQYDLRRFSRPAALRNVSDPFCTSRPVLA